MSNSNLVPIDKVVGRVISWVRMTEHDLTMTFADGARLTLSDDRQSCCENRYLTCDDDLTVLVGGVLHGIEAKPGPNLIKGEDEHGDHETMFVEIQGSHGFVTLTTHNEHSGYYGGFDLAVKVYAPDELMPDEKARAIYQAQDAAWNVAQDQPPAAAGRDPADARSALVINDVLLQSDIGMGDAKPRNRAERRKALKTNRLSNYKIGR